MHLSYILYYLSNNAFHRMVECEYWHYTCEFPKISFFSLKNFKNLKLEIKESTYENRESFDIFLSHILQGRVDYLLCVSSQTFKIIIRNTHIFYYTSKYMQTTLNKALNKSSSRLWNLLPSWCFPVTDLNCFKSRFDRHLS